MLTPLINCLVFFKLRWFADVVLRIISKLYGHRYDFSYSKPFWAAKSNSKVYVDYFIDPRMSVEKDICDLYRDIFYYDYTVKPGNTIVDVGSGLGHELMIFDESLNN